MFRAICVTAVIVTAAAVVLPAQRNRDRDRDRSFGLSQDEWCRQDRRADFCEVREETLRNTSTIDLDARGNGGVSIRGWDRSDVQMRARVTVWDDSRDAAAKLAKEIQITTTGGRIRADGPRDRRGRNRWDEDRWWSVAYELQVPRKSDMRVDATNGGITVADVRGRIDANTVNGGIRLDDVNGDIRGETVNGGLQVELANEKWEGPGMDLKTVNGGVTLAVPSGFSAELDARTANGGIAVDFPITISGLINNRRQVSGTIGSGGARIRLSAVNGGISISRR